MSSYEQIVAVAVVVLRSGKVLAMRRAVHKPGAGLWETLSGRVRPAEDPAAAAAREVLEESGLDVEVEPRPLDAYAARRDGQAMTVIVYRAQYVGGEVRLSHEHDQYAWWTPDEFALKSTLDRLVRAVRRAAAE